MSGAICNIVLLITCCRIIYHVEKYYSSNCATRIIPPLVLTCSSVFVVYIAVWYTLLHNIGYSA